MTAIVQPSDDGEPADDASELSLASIGEAAAEAGTRAGPAMFDERPVADGPRARVRRVAIFAIGVAATVVALAAVLSSAGGLDDVLGALERVSAGWTLAAAAAVPAAYTLLALHLRRLAAGRISIWQAARADLLLFGLGNVLPGAPASGALLAARELRRDGLSTRRARFALVFTMWFNVRTLLGLGALAFLVVLARQHPGTRESGLWWLAALGVIIALAATAAMAARQTTAQHGARLLARLRISRARPPAAVTRAAADAWHAEAERHGRLTREPGPARGDRRGFLAGGRRGSLARACRRRRTARTRCRAARIRRRNRGLGAAAATGRNRRRGAAIPALLHHFGAPLDAALAGTLVYRGISMLLPAAAGASLIALGQLRDRRQQ